MKQSLETHDLFTTSSPRLYYLHAKKFLNQPVEEEKLYDTFRTERLEDDKSI